jgi:uncharacterized membrane protein (TIGR02234 family)
MTRRGFVPALLACLAGAALALYAITRVWSVEETPRTGMSALRTEQTGAAVAPWVIGLALVALAGTGALLATSGWPRRTLGVLLTVAGAGVAVGAIVARLTLTPGTAGAGASLWPAACALGGAIIAAGGLTAARQGHRWPAMSARYDRNPAPPPSPAPETAQTRPSVQADHRAAWEALDRGTDPTEP